MGKIRITAQTVYVLSALVAAKDEISGADIARLTRLSSGTLYPILRRLDHENWVESKWEEGDPHKLGKPRRRLYRITALGQRRARNELTAIEAAVGKLAWDVS